MKARTRKAIYTWGPPSLVAIPLAVVLTTVGLAGCSASAPEKQAHLEESESYGEQRESDVEVHEYIEEMYVEHTFYLRDGREVTCLVQDPWRTGKGISCDWPEKE